MSTSPEATNPDNGGAEFRSPFDTPPAVTAAQQLINDVWANVEENGGRGEVARLAHAMLQGLGDKERAESPDERFAELPVSAAEAREIVAAVLAQLEGPYADRAREAYGVNKSDSPLD